MIINKAKYNPATTVNAIEFSITSSQVGAITLKAWSEDTFMGSTFFTITPTITTTTGNTRTFSVPLTTIGSSNNIGLQFFEISIAGTPADVRVICIGNLTKYHECLTNKLLQVKIPCEGNGCGCDDEKCKEIMDDCGNNIFYITALLNTIYRAINCSEWQKAADILNAIKEATKDCCVIEKTGDRKNDINIYIIKDKVELCVQERTVS